MIFPRRKHALTLQLHTAHILSAHESLEQKNKSIQDVKEQKNKLSISLHVFLPTQPPRLLDPWNADLCCSITYFYLSRPGWKARGINCSMHYERFGSSPPARQPY